MAGLFAGWKRRGDGSIAVNPVTGWDAFVPFGMAVGLRVHYAASDADLVAERFEKLPLILTPKQARELLSDVLLRTADAAERTP